MPRTRYTERKREWSWQRKERLKRTRRLHRDLAAARTRRVKEDRKRAVAAMRRQVEALPQLVVVLHDDYNGIEKHHVFTSRRTASDKAVELAREANELFLAQRPHLPIERTGSARKMRSATSGRLTLRQRRPGEQMAWRNLYLQVAEDRPSVAAWMAYKGENPNG